MARSLLDTVDLARVRAAAPRDADGGQPAAVALACLVVGGALQHDPADPAWPDRDRLVLGGAGLPSAARGVFAAAGPVAADADPWIEAGPAALAVATGLAAASALEAGVWRVHAVLDAAVCEAGVVWEAARAAGGSALPLTTLVTTTDREASDRAAHLFAAAGWSVRRAAADDVAAVMGDLDLALASAVPVALVGRP